VDRACTRDLGLIVTDAKEFFSEERVGAEHSVEHPVEGVPLYRLVNTCRQGRYRIEKTIFTHPHQDAVLQITCFSALKGKLDNYHVYALLAPHLGNRGAGNSAWLGTHRGVPMLFARRGGQALALACSAPWVKGAVGYVGVSDGWQDLSQHKQLTWAYDRAEDGNVALTGEVDLGACGGVFVLAVGFGRDDAEAGHRALASILDDVEDLQMKYVRGWQDWQQTLSPPRLAGKGGRDLYRISTAVLQTHNSGSIPGAFIASLSTPWGESRGDEAKEKGTGGYHLVWPRDLVETAGGLLAAGGKSEGLRVLSYLRATQMADGHWSQNMWVSSARFWTGIQLGETAFPILLLDLLRREGGLPDRDLARYWPMVRRAVGFIVRSGPSTQQDRWEDQRGYTPFTLAAMIAALLIAAELADGQNEAAVGAYLRETADAWNAAIESWLYVTNTGLARRLGVEGYYVRSIPPELDEEATPRIGHVMLRGTAPIKGGISITEIVSVDALALVRFGLRAPDDPRIVNTVKVIDAALKVETPGGPAWHRFSGDAYGEKEDGSPYDGSAGGIGRAWPLLTGERAHFELAAGRRDEAIRLLRAMESLAGDGGMIPEQVWDTDDIPARRLCRGKPTGSAMPLAWAHAEYLKLRRSLQDGRTFDRPPQTVQRYLEQKTGSPHAVWRFEHPRRAISPGEVLRVEALAPAVVHWSTDAWKTSHDLRARDTGLGVHAADLDTRALKSRDTIELTFHWSDPDRWEGKDYSVAVV
jgi:glucoamylase